MKFKKLRIIEAGMTANSAETGDGRYLPMYITEEAVQSVVTLGNTKPIHCRRTHNGNDMLDGYIGSFSNFVYENGVAYADLELSAALLAAYPQEAKFIETMIEKETQMIGISIMGTNDLKENKENERFDITEFYELLSCDLVGLPAATSSLFNTNQKEKKMNKFFSAFADMFKQTATKLATEIVKTREGGEITIEAAGEEMAIGDMVFDSEGNAVADGEIVIVTEEGEAIIVVEGGAIKEVKPVESEEEETKVEETTAVVPEEFSQRLDALETALATQTAAINDMVAKFSKATKQPATAARGIPKKKETKLSKDAVNAAAKRYL